MDLWLDTSSVPHSLKQYSTTNAMWVAIATTYIKISSTGIGKPFATGDGVKISGVKDDSLSDLNNTMISRWPKCEERLGQDLGSTGRRIALKPDTFDAEIARLRKTLPEFFPMIDILVPEKIKDANDEKKIVNIKRAKALAKEVFIH
jgi:hypothetical protein